MALFNFNSNKKKVEHVIEEQPKHEENRKVDLLQSIKTDNMDLSQPYIDDERRSGAQWVWFGENNLYPNILNQLYLSSPMHSSCVDFKTWSLMGDGHTWKDYDKISPKDKIKIKTFEKRNKINFNLRKISKDWIKHGRAIVLLHYVKEDDVYDFFKVLDPSEIRNNRVTVFTEDCDLKYYYSDNWTYRKHLKDFSAYKKGNKDEWQIFEIKNDVGSSRTYGLPDWISSANWQSVSADLGLLHKSALENGIQPSILFKYPYLMDDEEEENWLRNMRDNQKGVKNFNKGVKIEANGPENMPEVDILNTTDNHQLFEQTSKEQKEEIAISHNINPALMGVRIAGSLGAQEEIEFSARQFEKVWLNNNRTTIEDFLNDICRIMGIGNEFIINKTEITSIMAEKNKEAEQQELEGDEPKINENLRGLSAKENADIYRIIRDYGRGKLNKAIAKARIMGYGIKEEAALEILEEGLE